MWLIFSAAVASDWGFRAELGGQFEAASHGIANFSAQKGGLSLALITDTVQVRYDGNGDRGRWWLAARGQAGAAGLVSTRWVDGAPSPEQSQLGFYAGPEGGAVRYGPAGTYAGVQASVRYFVFAPLPETLDVADNRPVVHPEALLGWWSEDAEGYVRAGIAFSPGTLSPAVHGVFRLHPRWRVAPWVEVRAGVAEQTDLVTQTRLGGLNRYVVPLAGAAWAEFWVEDYAAIRAGPRIRLGNQTLAPVVDAAVFDGRTAIGLGGYLEARWKTWELDLGAGIAPGLERPGRNWAASSYVSVAVGF